MSILDLGPTIIDDFGRAITSNKAIRLPERPVDLPPTANTNTMPAPTAQSSAFVPLPQQSSIAPTPESLGQTRQSGPILNQKQGPGQLPTTSIPSEIYRQGLSEMPNRNDPQFQHHGKEKFFDVLRSLAFAGAAPMAYQRIKQEPFNQAREDWATKLKFLEPAVRNEEAQKEYQGRHEIAESQAKSLGESRQSNEQHQRAMEDLTKELRITEQQNAETRRKQEEDNVANQKIRNEIALKAIEERAKTAASRPNAQNDYIKNLQKSNLGEQLTPEEQAFNRAYEANVKLTKTDPGVARTLAFGDIRPTQVADESGGTHWESSNQAIGGKKPTIASTPFQVLRQTALANVPTQTIRTMAQRSATILPEMERISDSVDALKDKVGAGAGRWNKLWINKAGLDDPEFAKLDTDLELLASAITLAHGLHQEYQKQLKKHFDEAQSPDDLKARIASADSWILGYSKMIPNKNTPKVTAPASPGLPTVNNPAVPKFDISGVK